MYLAVRGCFNRLLPCHLLACRARKLTDEQRSAIAAYFAVYKGQASCGAGAQAVLKQSERDAACLTLGCPTPDMLPQAVCCCACHTLSECRRRALPSWPLRWTTTPPSSVPMPCYRMRLSRWASYAADTAAC